MLGDHLTRKRDRPREVDRNLPFANALRRNGAQLVARGGIPLDALAAALDDVEAAAV